LDFRPSGFDRKLKCEDPFSHVDKIFGPNEKTEYIFPFHIPEYNLSNLEILTIDFINRNWGIELFKIQEKLLGNLHHHSMITVLVKLQNRKHLKLFEKLRFFLKSLYRSLDFLLVWIAKITLIYYFLEIN